MKDAGKHPGITYHKMPVGGNVGGLLFAVACLTICLVGIPALRFFLLLALVVGAVIAAVLHFLWP